jgi:hypothetical protein
MEEIFPEKEIEEVERDIEWFAENFERLSREHEGKYVAVRGKRVIAESDDYEELLRNLKERGVNPLLVYITSIPPRSFACIL